MNAMSLEPVSLKSQEPSAPAVPPVARTVIRYVLENFADSITLEDLARQANMTRFNFCRKFRRECGLTPMRWLWNLRTVLAAEFLAIDPAWSLTDVAFSCGFTSSAHFSRSFKAMFRRSPSDFRKSAQEARADGRRDALMLESLYSERRDLVLRAAVRALNR